MFRPKAFQAAGVNGITQDVPMVGIRRGQGRRDLGCSLPFGWQHLVLHGGPVEGDLALKVRNGHLGNRWILTCEDDPVEMEIS